MGRSLLLKDEVGENTGLIKIEGETVDKKGGAD